MATVVWTNSQSVVKGPGRSLLGKNTAEKLGVLKVGPDVCSLTVEGSDADIREKYREVFTGVGKLKDFQLKLLKKTMSCRLHNPYGDCHLG